MNSHCITRLVIVLCCLVVGAGCFLEHRLNQRAAIKSMRQLREGEKSFKSRNGYYGTLEQLAKADLIDPNLAKG